MLPAGNIKNYDVLIVGAGPAGCACALTLKDAGLNVAMLDKSSFPRDKICGDAIPGRAIKVLKSIEPRYEQLFKKLTGKYDTRRTKLVYKNKTLTFDWVAEAYTCTRMVFDNFLFSLVKENTDTAIYTATLPYSITRNSDAIIVKLKDDPTVYTTKILIGADGAHSIVAKHLAPRSLDRDHHVGSVRGYFSNVAGMDSNTTEIYFDKKFLPSYLWVFPLPGNMVNAGFGMLSSEIARRRINLKTSFYEFIDRIPTLKDKFQNASLRGRLEGFGLPLGSKPGALSGERLMLTGDAASLIDPISGDGIGNAMLSGKFAAMQAIQCFKDKNFSAAHMLLYDKALLSSIGKELAMRYKTQRTLSKVPVALDIAFFACRNKMLKQIIQRQL